MNAFTSRPRPLERPHSRPRARLWLPLAAAFAILSAQNVRADGSEASALSLLPIGVLSAAPVAMLASGATLTVVAVQASAEGTVWVLERASDGARATLKLSGQASAAVGNSVVVTAMATGWVLSVAGQAIACVPNEIGASLLYNERVTR